MCHAWIAAVLRGGPALRAASAPAAPEITATIETPPAVLAVPDVVALEQPIAPAPSAPPQAARSTSVEQRPQRAEAPAGARDDAAGVGIADSTYYGVRQLDVLPRPAAPIEITYPASARDGASSGRVNLLLLISESGRVDDISIIDAEPPGVFDAAARRVFENMQFTPGERAGRRVRARLVVEVNFGGR